MYIAEITFNLDLQTMFLLMIAAMNMVTLIISRRTEKNTNSMKDALVDATAKASHAEGMTDQRKETADVRAAVAGQAAAAAQAVAQKVEVANPQPVKVEVVAAEPVPVVVKDLKDTKK